MCRRGSYAEHRWRCSKRISKGFVTGHWIVGAKRFGPSYSLPKVQINKIACVIADVIT
jgi:hypothetical protein